MDPLLPSFYSQPPLSSSVAAAAPPSSQSPPPLISASSPPPAQTSSGTPPPHNHIAHAANAASPLSQSFSHPPYAEMIYAAITALKESDGSSKRAIAKFIEESYTGLPPTHSALLTHHLKRLKANGLLVMVKKSYKLPRSDDGTATNAATTPTATTAQPQPSPSPTAAFPAPSPTSSKRGRGRPPKPKPDGLYQVNGHPIASAQPVSAPQDAAITAAQPVLVSLGLADDPAASVAKRSRGRPKKAPGVVGQVIVPKRGRGRPPTGGTGGPKKSPGRPRKLKSVGGIKRGRPGRLPKVVIPQLVTAPGVPAAPAAVAVFTSPRPRGRPKKIPIQAAAGIVIGPGVAPVKRPGRPPKIAKVMTPKMSTGRPVGRPRKNANESWAPQSQMQTEAYGDLKSKLDFFQSRVKEAVGVLKPHLTGAAISAVVAIQELEGLAAMDVNTPLAMESLEQAQAQPQLQPQVQPQLQPQVQSHLPPMLG